MTVREALLSFGVNNNGNYWESAMGCSIPDGWVPLGYRMPVLGEKILFADNGTVNFGYTFFSTGKDWIVVSEEQQDLGLEI